jgi:hypothetical protein
MCNEICRSLPSPGLRLSQHQSLYYGANAMLHKMKIEDKKPKSRKRLEMVDIHSMHASMDTERRHDHLSSVIYTVLSSKTQLAVSIYQ